MDPCCAVPSTVAHTNCRGWLFRGGERRGEAGNVHVDDGADDGGGVVRREENRRGKATDRSMT